VSNSPEDVAGHHLTGEKLGRARSSGIVAPLPDEVGAPEGGSHLPVAAVDVDRRRSLSVESAPAELILAGAGHPSTDQAAVSTTPSLSAVQSPTNGLRCEGGFETVWRPWQIFRDRTGYRDVDPA
jgi:hypothetical protein